MVVVVVEVVVVVDNKEEVIKEIFFVSTVDDVSLDCDDLVVIVIVVELVKFNVTRFKGSVDDVVDDDDNLSIF